MLADVTSRVAATDGHGADIGPIAVTAGSDTTLHHRGSSLTEA